MNDNEKFRRFFGFDSSSEQPAEGHPQEPHTEIEPVADQNALEKATATAVEWHDKYVALSADFQNYKKRVETEKTEWFFSAQKRVFLDLLAIIDTFERALEEEKKHAESERIEWIAGFSLIYQSMEKMLKKYDIQEITEISSFDPKFHEALVQVESENHSSGAIVQVLQKGYIMQGKVIRPVTVSVAK